MQCFYKVWRVQEARCSLHAHYNLIRDVTRIQVARPSVAFTRSSATGDDAIGRCYLFCSPAGRHGLRLDLLICLEVALCSFRTEPPGVPKDRAFAGCPLLHSQTARDDYTPLKLCFVNGYALASSICLILPRYRLPTHKKQSALRDTSLFTSAAFTAVY